MLSQLLFGLLIFFLPSNLAYHFYTPTAIIQGTLVDYLIPKLYLTDILIIGILVSWLFSSRTGKRHAQDAPSQTSERACRKLPGRLLLVIFFLITLVRGLLTSHPLAATYFWLKLLEMTLFICWLRSHLTSKIYQLTSTALTGAVIWQSLVALLQWLKQGSIATYLFLGEPHFSVTTPGIAKSGFAGAIKVLPYGTTPHPNVLGGFLALSLLIIWLSSPHRRGISKYIATLLGLVALYLTQSLSAWVALSAGLVLIGLKPFLSTHRCRLIIPPALLGIIIAATVFISLYNNPKSELLWRRHQLNLAAIRIWHNSPLFGIGLNQFTVQLPASTEITASTRFLQPVHNLYLLLLSETGLIGFVIVILAVSPFIKKFSIPLVGLLIIGLVDHYPLTLQTGQLLMALSLGLAVPSSLLSISLPNRRS